MLAWLRILGSAVLLVVAAAACGRAASVDRDTTLPPRPTIAITIRSGAHVLRTRTLGCDPPMGTAASPAAACAALRDYLRHPPRPHLVCHCAMISPGSRFAIVRGTLDGANVDLRFGPCPCGARTLRDLRIATGLRSFSPPA